MIRVIAFDLDDTLWDIVPVMLRAEQKLDSWLQENVTALKYSVVQMRELRHQVLADSPELAGQITQLRRRIIIEAMLQSSIPMQTANELSNQAIEVFLQARNQIELYPGTEEILLGLGKDFQLGALSNGNANITRLGLDHIFDFDYSAEQVGAPKPAPNLFLQALRYTEVKAQEMIYVGDDPLLDIDAAKDLGIHAIWFDHGKKDPGLHTADERITSIDELSSAVQNIVNRNP